ncbi:MAG TPA: Crp/Fnr family transcriptional regulator [Pyrinomonadaceae bacterium]|jgi:CRP-like cAMP-binding protein|nr:Crp/Fnr family transcriptional regulator [Pyrinomonadaceae bacterium]
MNPNASRTRTFQTLLRESLMHPAAGFRSVRFARQSPIFVSGDAARNVYFIESGQVKLLMPSPDGKEGLLAIHTEGDTFGELCISGAGRRDETAITMTDTVVRELPSEAFVDHLKCHSLLEGFVHYLANRVAEQQRVIANLITVDSEHRLGETLLSLARKLGQPQPRSTRIERKITHEELSEMVGTTRPRITRFLLQFRALGLIEITREHFLIIKEKQLSDYLMRSANVRSASHLSRIV